MKKVILSFISFVLFSVILKAQIPQSFNYQAVVRDANGNLVQNQNVQFRFSIIQDNTNGTVVYQETHQTTTNNLGLVTLAIGQGIPTQGSFSSINWASAPHFLKVEVDISGGSNFVDMGTTQLLSVPYALHAQTAANVQNYTAGNGISISGNVIENTAPDVPITITGQGATTVSGTYPNFVISSTDSNTTYSAGTGLNLTGTTFSHAPHTGDVSGTTNLTVTGIQGTPVNNITPTTNQVLQFNGSQWTPTQPSNLISAGNGLYYSGNTLNTVWSQAGNNIYNNNSGRVGIGINAPTGKVTIQGDTSNVLFEVRDKDGNPVFVVYQDSVHVFVSNSSAKANKGCFAVNPKAQTKAGAHTIFRIVPDSIVEIKDAQGLPIFQAFQDSVQVFVDNTGAKANKGCFAVNPKAQTKAGQTHYLRITPDSSRVYTEDPEGGFGVRDLSGGSATSYMQLTPDNYFIGHEAGKENIDGKFNIYTGYNSGMNSQHSNFCTFLGYNTGTFNESSDNTFIGYTAGMFHRNGGGNVFIGSKAGQYDSLGMRNVFIGENAGIYNKSGHDNVFVGNNCGYNNNTGYHNIFIGINSGFNNNNGLNNVFLGYNAGQNNVNGNCNVFIGQEAGFNNINSHYNTYIGMSAGYSNQNGAFNTMMGCNAGYFMQSGNSNTFLGCNAGWRMGTGNANTFIGTDCGRGGNDTSIPSTNPGNGNSCIGNGAAYFLKDAHYNTIIGTQAGYFIKNGTNNVYIGYQAGFYDSLGSNNVFIGNKAGYLETGSNQLYIENTATSTTPLIHGDFANDRVAFNRKADTYPFQVGNNSTNGNAAYLTPGGTWTNASSKDLKDRFEDINTTDLLDKIEHLNVKAWYYKGTQERHIGPFAEDFYQAFGTGVLNEPKYLGKSLAAADVAGVSLAAVKELIKENKRLDQKNKELENEIQTLKNIILTIKNDMEELKKEISASNNNLK